jgi:hypothetical protein
MPKLTLKSLHKEAEIFSTLQSQTPEKDIFGITDGKAVGTFLEHKFRSYLQNRYEFEGGNSASGIDFPGLLVDMKVTSIRQPQSSCPFKSARQKIYGLGYSLLIFVYDKFDDNKRKAATLDILHTIFVEAERTADFQMTSGLRQILANHGNTDDIVAFLQDRNLPADEIELNNLASEIINNPPIQGFLTISNALQWRLQYSRVMERAGLEKGVLAIYRAKR